MNVKMVYLDSVESYDTRADGSAATTKACLDVERREAGGWSLCLWSRLFGDDAAMTAGPVATGRGEAGERGYVHVVASLSDEDGRRALGEGYEVGTISGFLWAYAEALPDSKPLLRVDLDGETVWPLTGVEDDEDAE